MKYYFVGDAHLGCRAWDIERREEMEREFLSFLTQHTGDKECGGIFLMGDIFDFWFEFAHSIPDGYDNVLEQIRKVAASGVKIHFIPGNHDQWTYGYLASLGVTVHKKTSETTLGGKRIFLAHGHGLNSQGKPVKLMNAIFESPFCQWGFRHLVMPKAGLWFGRKWSASNHRKHNSEYKDDGCIDYYEIQGGDIPGDEQVEWVKKNFEKLKQYDYIIMGHRHQGIDMMMKDNVRLVILDGFFVSGMDSAFCIEA